MNLLNRVLILVCCGILGFGFVNMSFGADWKFYYRTEVEKEDKTVTEKSYFDESSIERLQKKMVRVMQKTTRLWSDEKTETDSKMRLIEIDCSSYKFRYLSVTEYEEETGKAIAEERTNNAPWTRFSLDSIMGGLYNNVCFEKKQPKQAEKKPDKETEKQKEKQPAK